MRSLPGLAAAAAAALLAELALAQPLCHREFRGLERCIANDYDRLNNECAGDYSKLKGCLKRDWKHLDDAGGYPKPAGSFNRMRTCRHGVMLYNPLDWYIGRGLEVYGEWGEKKVQIWERIVKKGQVAIDVGAHVGALTLPLSKLVGAEGRVVAFEPFYPSFSTLAANVGLNSLQNVELRQAVVADRGGRVFMNRDSLAFSVHDFFNFGSMNFNTFRIYNATDDVERPSSTWDEYQVMLLDQLSLARLDFVKVDAEAMESAVLQGAQRMIKKFKPILFIEYRNPWEKETGMLDFLRKKMRYECVLLRIPVWNIDNYRGFSEDIWGGATKLVSFNLLCKHRWWEYPDVDEAILELFDTAVDTDIEGLRTTPTADPFEAMALSGQGGIGGDAFVAGGDPSVADGAGADMTLDELLGDLPPEKAAPARAAKPAASKSPSAAASSAGGGGKAKKKYEEMTLAELLDEVPQDLQQQQQQQRQPQQAPLPQPAGQRPKQQNNKKYEEMTLDELLDDSQELLGKAPKAAEAAASRPRGAQPQGQQQPKKQKKYEEMTLDELLDDTENMLGADAGAAKAKPSPQQAPQRPRPQEKKKKRYEDMTLDELLDDPGFDDEPPKRAGQQDEAPSSRRAEELSLEELLGEEVPAPAPPSRGPQAKAKAKPKAAAGGAKGGGKAAAGGLRDMTLDELLGPEDPSDGLGGKKWEEMTLDELLGPEPPGGGGDGLGDGASLIDELLGPPGGDTKNYEEMSLDELLSLDDEPPKRGPAPRAAAPKAAPRAAPRPQPGPRPKQGTAKAGAPSPRNPSASGSAQGAGRPTVRVTYDDEMTLDEL